MIPILVIAAYFIIMSNQPLLMATAIFSYYGMARLFWRDGEPKIIFLGITLFWLTISIKLFYAVFSGVEYESLSNASNIVTTTYFALFAFVVFCWGMYAATKKVREATFVDVHEDFGYKFHRAVWVFVGSSAAVFVLKGFVFFIRGLDQLVYALIDLKTGFIFMLLYFTFTRRYTYTLVAGLLTMEIIFSFFSFFASFKDILLTTLLVLATPRIRLTMKSFFLYSLLAIVTLFLVMKWQAVKGDYRAFLNKGQRETQNVMVSREEALDKLQELSARKSNLTEDEQLIRSTIERISYIEFYAESMQRVPLFIPYEQGKIWAGNLAHVLLPRFFFPDKPVIDDSQMVNKYCIRKVATAKMGASWSLGFIAESYIDFGPVLMFVMVFLVGFLLGFIYSQILQQSINYFWGYTMLAPFYLKISCNGTPGSKILGWAITYFIAFFVFKTFLMKPLDNYLRHGFFKAKAETAP